MGLNRRIFRHQGIGELTARSQYYLEQHEKRFERRYKKTIEKIVGILGSLNGIRWING